MKPLLQHLLRAAAISRFLSLLSFVRFARSVIVFRAIQTTFAGAQLHIKTV